VLEGLGKVLLAERKLADGPDFGVRLESLLQLRREGTGLQGNDLGGGIRVVGNGRAALGAEETMDIVAGRALAGPLLDGAVDGELVLGDNGNERVGRATLALAVVTVVVTSEERGVDVNRVGDGLAETVSGERHVGVFLLNWRKCGRDEDSCGFWDRSESKSSGETWTLLFIRRGWRGI